MTNSNRKVRRKLWVGLLVLGIALFVTFLCRPSPAQRHEERLLDKATFVVEHGWAAVDGSSFQWLSDHDLLIIEDDGNNIRPVERLDMRTGKKTSLPDLTKHLRRLIGKGLLYRKYLSPDKKWLLVVIVEQEHYKGTFYALTLDGKQQLDWHAAELEKAQEACWMQDSQHWMIFVQNEKTGKYLRALIEDIKAPRTLKHIPIAPDSMLNHMRYSLDGVLSEKQILFLPVDRYRKDKTVPFYELSLYGGAKPLHTNTITLPVGTQARSIRISPDGKQVAWMLRSVYKPPYTTLKPQPNDPDLKPLASDFPSDARATDSIWISRPDGSGMHEIGYIDVRLHGEDVVSTYPLTLFHDRNDEPSYLQWLPGNKYLSLFIGDKMYRFGIE